MRKRYVIPLVLSGVLLLAGCKEAKKPVSFLPEQVTAVPAVPQEESEFVPVQEAKTAVVTAEDLQNGTWAGIYDVLYEELYFSGRSVIYTCYYVECPEKATVSEAIFSIAEDKLILYFEKTDYTNVMDLSMENGVPVVSVKYPEEDAPRIYRRIDANGSMPTGKESPSPQRETEKVSLGMKNALRAAKAYLDVMPFSRSGLVGQLEFDGYTRKEAEYAADNCNADWYQQAEKKAEQYLELMPFSKKQLQNQLEFDGFTHEEALYGVNKFF